MILIVGGGPAGLATAYYLQQRGLPYQILERHTVGYAWRNHYDRLHLHTLKQVSHLPGLPMPADYARFPSAAQFHAYLERYARYFRLNITCGVDVQRATWSADGWQLETSQGPMRGETLIAATGIWSTPYCPPLDGTSAFGGTIMHASEYRNAAPFRGDRVLVVGTGNSGTEIAVDLSEHEATTGIAVRTGATFIRHPSSPTAVRLASWLLRHGPRPIGERWLAAIRRNFDHLDLPWPSESLLDAYPVVGYALPKAVESGNVQVYPGVASFVPGGVQFDDGSTAAFDTVILATGYRPTVQFVQDAVELDPQGRPKVDQHWRSVRNPHLFCIGYWYPATEGWLQALGRVARQAVRAL